MSRRSTKAVNNPFLVSVYKWWKQHIVAWNERNCCNLIYCLEQNRKNKT